MGSKVRTPPRWLPVAIAPVALAYGVTATGIGIRHGDLTTYAGRSPGAAAMELAAGIAVMSAGLAAWRLRPERVSGALALAAGIAWFAPDWIGWQTGPGTVRILALAAQALLIATVAHIALSTGAPRVAIIAIWTAIAAIAAGRVLFYDPLADPTCVAYCATNPLLVASERSVARTLDWLNGGVAALALVAVLGMTIGAVRHPGIGRRNLVPILLPALLLLSVGALRLTTVAIRPGDDPDRSVLTASFVAGAIGLVALAAGLLWAASRADRAARTLRRLAHATEPLQAALVRATSDASLSIAFPLRDDRRWVDGDGRAVAMPRREAKRGISFITRAGRPIAAVLHDPASLDTAALEREIGAAAQLAVDNERLRAEERAHLHELKASRARIVAAADAERRRLERDLHDGAQQRLVGLCVALSMARGACTSEALDAADAGLHRAIDELRELAHGIHPVELSDEGLAAALESLADRASVCVRLHALPEGRAPQATETAAYVLVQELVARAGRRGDGATLSVTGQRAGDTLTVEVLDDHACSPADLLTGLIEVADRVSALDGALVVDAAPRGVRVRAELPCV